MLFSWFVSVCDCICCCRKEGDHEFMNIVSNEIADEVVKCSEMFCLFKRKTLTEFVTDAVVNAQNSSKKHCLFHGCYLTHAAVRHGVTQ